MTLALESRRIGDIIVLKCGGRIVEGDESAPLYEQVTAGLPHDPHIVLDLSAVESIDSGGLRTAGRATARRVRNGPAATSSGARCPRESAEILRVTKL